MEINNIQIIPVRAKDGLIAFASLTYGGIQLESIAIYTRLNGSGYRLLYPTKPVSGRDTSIFYPTNQKTSEAIEFLIIEKAKKLFNKMR